MGMRCEKGGINWIWYYCDTMEEAIEWYKELTGQTPYHNAILPPQKREPAAKYDDKYSFRLHR